MTDREIRALAADGVAAADLCVEARAERERAEAVCGPFALGNPRLIAAVLNEGDARTLHMETGRDLRRVRHRR